MPFKVVLEKFMAESFKKSEKDSNINKYCCVTCGEPNNELSHHYKEGVIKIMHCVRNLKSINTI